MKDKYLKLPWIFRLQVYYSVQPLWETMQGEVRGRTIIIVLALKKWGKRQARSRSGEVPTITFYIKQNEGIPDIKISKWN